MLAKSHVSEDLIREVHGYLADDAHTATLYALLNISEECLPPDTAYVVAVPLQLGLPEDQWGVPEEYLVDSEELLQQWKLNQRPLYWNNGVNLWKRDKLEDRLDRLEQEVVLLEDFLSLVSPSLNSAAARIGREEKVIQDYKADGISAKDLEDKQLEADRYWRELFNADCRIRRVLEVKKLQREAMMHVRAEYEATLSPPAYIDVSQSENDDEQGCEGPKERGRPTLKSEDHLRTFQAIVEVLAEFRDAFNQGARLPFKTTTARPSLCGSLTGKMRVPTQAGVEWRISRAFKYVYERYSITLPTRCWTRSDSYFEADQTLFANAIVYLQEEVDHMNKPIAD